MRARSDAATASVIPGASARPSRGRLAGVLLALCFATPGATDVVPDGSVGPADPLLGPDHVIPAEIGRQTGGNLFHSFGIFDVGTGESATFTNQGATAPIDHVLARVTGGETSDIDGVLRSTIPGADLYLLNPAGVLFGPNASLDVRGSFHATSADALEFPNGERFEAHPGGAVPVLSVAPPAAFGFVDAPAPLTVEGAALRVPDGERLSLVGGDLTIRGDSQDRATPELRAATGRIDLASLASPGRVELGEAAEPLGVEAGALGELRLEGGWVTTRGAAGGRVFIRGGALVLEEGAQIDSTTLGAGGNADEIGSIEIEAERLELRGGSAIDVRTAGAGRAGSISITANHVDLDSGSAIVAHSEASGDAGQIAIRSDELQILGDSLLGAFALGGGRAGRIEIEAGPILVDGSAIAAGSELAEAGRIVIRARGIELLGGSTLEAFALGGEKGGGSIEIVAGEVGLHAGATIDVHTRGSGPAGSISITADRILLDGSSALSALTQGAGSAGSIRIEAGELEVRDLSVIDATATRRGSGAAGSISITAGDLLLDTGSEIHAGVSHASPGGEGERIKSIEIDAERLELRGESVISVRTAGARRAESISITVDHLLLESGSAIEAYTAGAGAAGSVSIIAESVLIAGAVGTTSLDARSTETASGHAGTITIHAGEVRVEGDGSIVARGEGSGDAGSVFIEAEHVALVDGARVHARNDGTGSAGSVSIHASESVVVAGRGEGRGSQIDASVEGGGGGDVAIFAPDVRIEEGGHVFVSAVGGGQAGSALIEGDRIAIRGGGFLAATAATLGGDANAGSITLRATESVEISNQGGPTISVPRVLQNLRDLPSGVYVLSASGVPSGGGASGLVAISAPLVRVVDGGIVATASLQTDAGDIEISGDRIEILGGGVVDSSSAISGDAGTVTLGASSLVLVSGEGVSGAPSRVRSATAGAGSGGRIVVAAPDVMLDGGAIATTALRGAGGFGTGAGGQIRVVADRVSLVDGGRIDASSVSDGPGGGLVIEADESIRIQGETSGVFGQAAGTALGGNLLLTAPRLEIDEGNVSSESSARIEGVERIFLDLVDGLFIPPLAPEGIGAGGDVEIRVAELRLRDGASITARSEGESDAGSIEVLETRRIELVDSTITTEALEASGGNIVLDVSDRLVLQESALSASVGPGEGGNVTLGPGFVILDQGHVLTKAVEGQGGDISITTEGLIASTGSTISAESQLGIDGTVNVQSPDTDVVGELAALPEAPADATGLLRTRCAQRRSDQEAGRFLVLGRDGAPTTVPDGYLLASFPSAGLPATPGPTTRAGAATPVVLASLHEGCR